jgi:hypothetical protein
MKQIREKRFQTKRAGDAVFNIGEFFAASLFQRRPTGALSGRPLQSLVAAREKSISLEKRTSRRRSRASPE